MAGVGMAGVRMAGVVEPILGEDIEWQICTASKAKRK